MSVVMITPSSLPFSVESSRGRSGDAGYDDGHGHGQGGCRCCSKRREDVGGSSGGRKCGSKTLYSVERAGQLQEEPVSSCPVVGAVPYLGIDQQ